MCVTWPARVVGIDPQGATIDIEGRQRRASMVVVPDVAVGDWVLVGMGAILQRLDPEVATEMRCALREAIALDETTPTVLFDAAPPEDSGEANGAPRAVS